jgi:hypothetical protein
VTGEQVGDPGQQDSTMTHINTPALNQLRSTNNLVTVTDAADTDIVFGYILKRPPADIDRLWYQVLVLGPVEPYSGYLVAACFEGPNSGLCVLPDGRTNWTQDMPTLRAATDLCTRWAETLAQATLAEWDAHARGAPQPHVR